MFTNTHNANTGASNTSIEKVNNIKNVNNNVLTNYRTTATNKTSGTYKQPHTNMINTDKAKRNNSMNPVVNNFGARLNSLGKNSI